MQTTRKRQALPVGKSKMNAEISAEEATRLFAEWVEQRGIRYVSRVYGFKNHQSAQRRYRNVEFGRQISAQTFAGSLTL